MAMTRATSTGGSPRAVVVHTPSCSRPNASGSRWSWPTRRHRCTSARACASSPCRPRARARWPRGRRCATATASQRCAEAPTRHRCRRPPARAARCGCSTRWCAGIRNRRRTMPACRSRSTMRRDCCAPVHGWSCWRTRRASRATTPVTAPTPGRRRARPAQRAAWARAFEGPVARALEQLPARGVRVHALSTEAASDAWLSQLGAATTRVA